VRHSAANRGAEERIFAEADAHGVSQLTVNNTCYGRLLQEPGIAVADCYRYSLEQPAVRAGDDGIRAPPCSLMLVPLVPALE
jgi:hypothetical protein